MNAFTIPVKSAIVDSNRRLFPKTAKQYHRNLKPIVLPGSNKNPEPQMVRKTK